MKRIKSLIVLNLIFALVVSSFTVVGASKPKDSHGIIDTQLVKDLRELEEKYDIEFIENGNSFNYSQDLQFESVKEFELFLKEFDKFEKKSIEVEVPTSKLIENAIKNHDGTYSGEVSITPFNNVLNGSYVDSWYDPINLISQQFFMWRNIDLEFQYVLHFPHGYGPPLAQFVSVTVVDSSTSGISEWSWNHKSGHANVTTTHYPSDTAEYTVNGYYLLGVKIGGHDIGLKINGQWDRSIRVNQTL